MTQEQKQITEVCNSCGISANVLTCLKRYGRSPLKLSFSISTFHKGMCQVCGDEDIHVTEPRDFFYPEFELLKYFKDAWNKGFSEFKNNE